MKRLQATQFSNDIKLTLEIPKTGRVENSNSPMQRTSDDRENEI
jgi:hypothetical protein